MAQDSSLKRKSKEIDSTESIDPETSGEKIDKTIEKKGTEQDIDPQDDHVQDASNEAQEDIADLPTKEKQTEIDTEQAESLRRKRDREGSLEPVLTPSQKEIPAKKNRLQSDVDNEEPIGSAPSSPRRQTNVEGEKVGQIRKRVEDLSWKQRKEGHRDGGEDEEVEDGDHKEDLGAESNKRVIEEGDSEEKEGKKEKTAPKESDTSPPVKKSTQPTFSSFSYASGFAAAANNKNESGGSIFDQDTGSSKPIEKSGSKSPPPLPARTQPTFSSFSSSSSPFNSATASIAGPSWLAGKSTGSIGGLKPSSLGSVAGSSNSHVSNTEKPSTSPKSNTTTTFSSGKGLGFGAFASANPFSPKSNSRTGSPANLSDKNSNGVGESALTPRSDTKEEGEKEQEEGNGDSFDEALRSSGNAEEDGTSTRTKQKVETQLDKGQADLRTGEEDELAIASVRAKLFTMADDQSWKERGTGTVRCNIPKSSSKVGEEVGGRGFLGKGTSSQGGARLVMRSEGVLRLILNIKLFKGIQINLEQDKFLRIVAFEDGKPAHFALRIGNAAAASQFYYAIRDQIPTTENEARSVEELA